MIITEEEAPEYIIGAGKKKNKWEIGGKLVGWGGGGVKVYRCRIV
jgi:hypothetical protein